MTDKKPDWEAFGRWAWRQVCWPSDFCDIDGMDAFDAAKEHGIVREIPGGFNPERDIDENCAAVAGDPWYVEVSDD